MSSTDQTRKRSTCDVTGGTGSGKARKSNELSSPGAKTKETGFADLNGKLRSCLRSPLALPLIQLLHDDDDESKRTVDGLPSDFDELIRDIESGHFDEVKKQGEEAFEQAMKDWDSEKDSENAFTDKLLKDKLEAALTNIHKNANETTEASQGSTATADSAKSLSTKVEAVAGLNQNKTQQGDCDILFWERSCSDKSVALPICLLEFGIKSRYDWWTKIGEGHDYVAIMRNPTVKDGRKPKAINQYTFRYPMILSAITLKGTKGENVEGDFGTFLCIPVDGNDFRVVLLRRERVSDLATAKKEFGKIMQATFASRKWRQSKFMRNVDFECLGPNCTKVGNRLFRAYDTRLRRTDRSPELYKTPRLEATDEEKKEEDLPKVGFHSYSQDEEDEEMKTIVSIIESDDAIEFGSPYPNDLDSNAIIEMEWPWKKKGKLLVISVPYREGNHNAEKVSHFLPVLNHLIHLHSHGRVHGDIRAFNIVFESKQKGWLIDLDFGGVEGEAKYPKNFNFLLEDGKRIGEGGETIHKHHDYYALWSVFNTVHSPSASATKAYKNNSKKKGKFFMKKCEIKAVFETFSSNIFENKNNYDLACEELVKHLKAFFDDSDNDDIELCVDPCSKFSRLLNEQAGDDEANNDAKTGVEHKSPRFLAKTKKNIATGSGWPKPK